MKEPSWKHIEPNALELGLHSLHRRVASEDLFAKEAMYHKSCHNAFKLKYVSHLRETAKAMDCATGTEQNRKAAVHQKAFTTVLDVI